MGLLLVRHIYGKRQGQAGVPTSKRQQVQHLFKEFQGTPRETHIKLWNAARPSAGIPD